LHLLSLHDRYVPANGTVPGAGFGYLTLTPNGGTAVNIAVALYVFDFVLDRTPHFDTYENQQILSSFLVGFSYSCLFLPQEKLNLLHPHSYGQSQPTPGLQPGTGAVYTFAQLDAWKEQYLQVKRCLYLGSLYLWPSVSLSLSLSPSLTLSLSLSLSLLPLSSLCAFSLLYFSTCAWPYVLFAV
jgi:hypothetical protein